MIVNSMGASGGVPALFWTLDSLTWDYAGRAVLYSGTLMYFALCRIKDFLEQYDRPGLSAGPVILVNHPSITASVQQGNLDNRGKTVYTFEE